MRSVLADFNWDKYVHDYDLAFHSADDSGVDETAAGDASYLLARTEKVLSLLRVQAAKDGPSDEQKREPVKKTLKLLTDIRLWAGQHALSLVEYMRENTDNWPGDGENASDLGRAVVKAYLQSILEMTKNAVDDSSRKQIILLAEIMLYLMYDDDIAPYQMQAAVIGYLQSIVAMARNTVDDSSRWKINSLVRAAMGEFVFFP